MPFVFVLKRTHLVEDLSQALALDIKYRAPEGVRQPIHLTFQLISRFRAYLPHFVQPRLAVSHVDWPLVDDRVHLLHAGIALPVFVRLFASSFVLSFPVR